MLIIKKNINKPFTGTPQKKDPTKKDKKVQLMLNIP